MVRQVRSYLTMTSPAEPPHHNIDANIEQAARAFPEKAAAHYDITDVKKIEGEPFVGMWKDREDMQDSTAWVRDLRRKEWRQHS